jgi:hypothetical protein
MDAAILQNGHAPWSTWRAKSAVELTLSLPKSANTTSREIRLNPKKQIPRLANVNDKCALPLARHFSYKSLAPIGGLAGI